MTPELPILVDRVTGKVFYDYVAYQGRLSALKIGDTMRPKWVNSCGTWEYMAGGERVAVYSSAHSDDWYMNFALVGISPLDAKDAEGAKKEALTRVARILEGILDDIR